MASEDIKEALKAAAIQIRDEKQTGANTALRVGSLLLAICEALNLEPEELAKYFLRKDQDDRSVGTIASDKGFEAGKFNVGATGAACYQDKDGNWHIETDHLKVRKKASFTEVEIETTYHVGGQQMSTGASMVVDYVLEMDSCYRCYFLKKNGEGREIMNRWKRGDQAYCNTFNLVKQEDGTLGNHYLWRLVEATSNETADDVDVRTFGEVTINTANYHFTDLSKTVFAEGSDIPKAMDEIVLLGHQGDDESRQGCIIVAGAGEGSPYIYAFTGIGVEPFTLPEPEIKIKPGDNKFTGRMRIEGGSTGAANLVDLNIGAINLLLNSGFTGNYRAEDLDASYNLNSGSELFSKGLKHWTGMATASDDVESVSGKSVYIGSLSQSVHLIKDEVYVVSFKGKGKSVKVMLGGDSTEQTLASEYEKHSMRFTSDGICSFSISGDATICDLQLERGIISTDWNPNPNDNDKTLAEFQALKYLQDAIVNGDTTILGGLILSSVIKLGNYKDGVLQKENAGVSGIYNDDDDVAFWGGGAFEDAVRTVMKFKENPNYTPTETEWAGLANFVVSHGGDIFLRGAIFADKGYFRGTVDIADKKIQLNQDGSGRLANGSVYWTKEGIWHRRSPEYVDWVPLSKFADRIITYEYGTYIDLYYYGLDSVEDRTYTLSEPEEGMEIVLKYSLSESRFVVPAYLSGKFLVFTDRYTTETFNVLTVRDVMSSKGVEWRLRYVSGVWAVLGNYEIVDEMVVLVAGYEGGTTENELESETSEGLTETVTVHDTNGYHRMIFTGGLLTSYNYESTSN